MSEVEAFNLRISQLSEGLEEISAEIAALRELVREYV